MATLRYSIPGPGGSLGSCVVCGNTFLKEILMGESVDCVGISGFGDRNLPVHKECGEKLRSLQGPWEEIRKNFPHGPLYDCFEEEFQSKAERRTDDHGREGSDL
jgi:hypothetical protein